MYQIRLGQLRFRPPPRYSFVFAAEAAVVGTVAGIGQVFGKVLVLNMDILPTLYILFRSSKGGKNICNICFFPFVKTPSEIIS